MPTFEFNTRDITETTVTRNLEDTDVKITNNRPNEDGYIQPESRRQSKLIFLVLISFGTEMKL